jgi:predicted PurR-regulated permease PerM
MKKLDDNSKKILKIILISILVFFLFWYIEGVKNVVAFVFSVIQPLLIGLSLAYIINLPMNFYQEKVFYKLEEKEKTKNLARGLSMLLSWITIILVFVILLQVLIPRIAKSISSLVENWPLFVKNLEEIVNSNEILQKYTKDLIAFVDGFKIEELTDSVLNYLKTDGTNILSKTSSIFKNVSGFFFSVFVSVVFSIYILMNKVNLQKNSTRLLYSITSEEKADYVYRVFSLSYKTFAEYLKSKLISTVVLGLLVFVGMLIFQIPYAAMISVLVGASDLIPVFGPIVGSVISMILIFIESPIKSLIFIIYVLIAQQVQNNIIYPLMAKDQIGLPSLWIFAAIVLGGALFGVIGMLIGIPVASIIYTLSREKVDKELSKKGITDKNIDMKIKENKYFKEEK